ncbi:MAG: hypothetical protein WCD83_09685, partial [Pseudolabrys sp.]
EFEQGDIGCGAACCITCLVKARMARDHPHRVASLAASEKMSATEAVFPILPGFSTNTISKMIIAGISGGRSFALRVIPGLIIVVLAAWAGTLNILTPAERINPPRRLKVIE